MSSARSRRIRLRRPRGRGGVAASGQRLGQHLGDLVGVGAGVGDHGLGRTNAPGRAVRVVVMVAISFFLSGLFALTNLATPSIATRQTSCQIVTPYRIQRIAATPKTQKRDTRTLPKSLDPIRCMRSSDFESTRHFYEI